MAVTLKLVRQGRTGTLADSMDAEYRAAVRLVVSRFKPVRTVMNYLPGITRKCPILQKAFGPGSSRSASRCGRMRA